MRYIPRPVAIDAIYYDNTPERLSKLKEWVESFGDVFVDHFDAEAEGQLVVFTLEGTSYAVPNNYYIIRGLKGEYYPCEGEIFNLKYMVA